MLHEVPFWAAAQSGFLREVIGDDPDLQHVADATNAKLHSPHWGVKRTERKSFRPMEPNDSNRLAAACEWLTWITASLGYCR